MDDDLIFARKRLRQLPVDSDAQQRAKKRARERRIEATLRSLQRLHWRPVCPPENEKPMRFSHVAIQSREQSSDLFLLLIRSECVPLLGQPAPPNEAEVRCAFRWAGVYHFRLSPDYVIWSCLSRSRVGGLSVETPSISTGIVQDLRVLLPPEELGKAAGGRLSELWEDA